MSEDILDFYERAEIYKFHVPSVFPDDRIYNSMKGIPEPDFQWDDAKKEIHQALICRCEFEMIQRDRFKHFLEYIPMDQRQQIFEKINTSLRISTARLSMFEDVSEKAMAMLWKIAWTNHSEAPNLSIPERVVIEED